MDVFPKQWKKRNDGIERDMEDADFEAAAAAAVEVIAEEWKNNYGYESEPGSDLSNGDQVSPDVKPNIDRIAEYGIWLTASPAVVEVTGLTEPESVDLAELVTVTFEGAAPHLIAECAIDRDREYIRAVNLSEIPGRIPFTGENGDSFTLTIPYDEQRMLDMGYRVENAIFTATVSGVSSYSYSLESADDPRMASLIDMGRERAWNYALDSSGALPGMMDPERDGRILWDRAALNYAGVWLGQAEAEDKSSNAMFLLYRFAAPMRYANQEAAAVDCWIAVYARDVLLGPDGELSSNEEWSVEGHQNREAMKASVEQWMNDRLGEGFRWVSLDSEAGMVQIEVPEAARTVRAEPGVFGSGERTSLVDIVPSFAANTSAVETVMDPYGTEHARSLEFNADERAKAEYELNGRYAVFAGTMSTYNEANTNARMSMYISNMAKS